MVRVSTQRYLSENLTFSYEVNVDKEGVFTTTIPADVVTKLKEVNIHLNKNRLHNEGFFSDKSLHGLNKQVHDTADLYSKKELISERIILKYTVQTMCHYCKTKSGELVPDGYWQIKIDGGDDYKWEGGTKETGTAMDSSPYGLTIYVKPYRVKEWKFPNGETTKEYDIFHNHDKTLEEDEILNWLNSLVHIYPDGEEKEIDYTPEIGLMFKNMILYICNLNEKIKSVFGEEFDLDKIDLNRVKLLGFGGKQDGQS